MKKKLSLFVIFLLVFCCLTYTVRQRWKGPNNDAWKSVIENDGYGYYAYLPCVFFYHELAYQKTIGPVLKRHPELSYNYVANYFNRAHNFDKQWADKYPIGMALLVMPFFLLAYFLSFISGSSLDGYGFFFQASVSMAALFYLLLGLLYLRKLLKRYNISEWGIAITCILLVAATNLTYYATMETSMSHVYSFGLTAFFLYYAKRSIENFRQKHLILMAVSMVILILVRPTNILTVLMIPFLAGTFRNSKEFFDKLFSSYKIIIPLLLAIALLSLQLLVWHSETGKWFIWSYSGESFNFWQPHFIDILFSYRKGWFIYTPVMFVLLISGLIIQFKQNKFKFFIMLLYFTITTYVLSSWWCWSYGGSYGSRAFIDYYPAFCLLPIFWYKTIVKPLQKILLIVFISVFCVINLIQVYQYTYSIMPYDNKYMNAKIFWKMFLKTDWTYQWAYSEPLDTNAYIFDTKYQFKNDFEHNTWGNDNTITSQIARSGKHAVLLDTENECSPIFKTHVAQLGNISPSWVYVSLWLNTSHLHDNATLTVTVAGKEGATAYFYHTRQLEPYAYDYNAWNNMYWVLQLPDFKSPDDMIEIFVVNGNGTVLLDDMNVKFGVEKK